MLTDTTRLQLINAAKTNTYNIIKLLYNVHCQTPWISFQEVIQHIIFGPNVLWPKYNYQSTYTYYKVYGYIVRCNNNYTYYECEK